MKGQLQLEDQQLCSLADTFQQGVRMEAEALEMSCFQPI